MGIKRSLIHAVKNVDSKLLNDSISHWYSRYKLIHGEQLYNIRSLRGRRFSHGKKLKIIASKELSINDLILAQYYNNDFLNYKNCDMAVRLMAVDEYYKKTGNGFELYRKMQAASGFDWTCRYTSLIESYEKNGYASDSHIELDSDLNIMDGSHRLTLGYYFGQEFINADIYNSIRNRPFDIGAFWEKSFTREQCILIKEKSLALLESANYPFIGVIWPPAYFLADDIIKDINSYDQNNVTVTEYNDFELEPGEFIHLFKALYHTDILDENGMNDKISLIEQSMSDEQKSTLYPIRVFALRIKQPQMGLNPKNYQSQSMFVKKLKTTFRKRYESSVKNYKYDVIMHISDNYIQSIFCRRLFEIDQDISGFFNKINNVPYVIIRAKNSRQHPKFPQKLYFRSDSDIIVNSREALAAISEAAELFAKEHFSGKWINIVQTGEDYEKKIQIFLRDFMLFQFEISTHINGLDDSFRDECFEHIIHDAYNYLPVEDEIIIRLIEYTLKPKKKWYIGYLRANIGRLDKERLMLHVDNRVVEEKRLRKMIKYFEQ